MQMHQLSNLHHRLNASRSKRNERHPPKAKGEGRREGLRSQCGVGEEREGGRNRSRSGQVKSSLEIDRFFLDMDMATGRVRTDRYSLRLATR